MSNTHDGVSCDNCMKSNFSGKRYKCLICYDFDLCSTCYDQSQSALSSTNASSSSSSSSIQNETLPGPKLTKKAKSKKLRASESAVQVIKPPATVQASSSNVQINQNSHLNTHAMQCILTRGDHELFYGSGGCDFTIGGGSGIEQQSFTCPYCAKFGFSETTLCKHLGTHHSNLASTSQTQVISGKKEVVCPICAVLPSSNGGDPNHLTDNLLQHINMEHIINTINNNNNATTTNHNAAINNITSTNNKTSNRNLDDTLNDIGINSLNGSSNVISSSSANAVAAAAAALRFSRRLNYSQNTSRSSLTAQSGITIGNSSNRAGGSSINRYAFQFGQSSNSANSGVNALSSFIRSTSHTGSGLDTLTSSLSNQIDPIAELLSQLTGVRRAASSTYSASSQLQQLQQQLNRERENLQQQTAAAAVIAAAAGSGSQGTSTRHHHMHHHLFGGGIGGSITKSQLLNSLSQSKSNNQNIPNSQNSVNQALQTANNITNAFSNQVLELPPNYLFIQTLSPRDPRYLLSKYDFNNTENQDPNPNINQIYQSLFINDILTSLLTKYLNANELSARDPNATQGQNKTSNINKSNNTNSFFNQMSQTSENDQAEDLLKTAIQASSDDICVKNKTNLVSSPEHSKLLEL